MYDFMANPLAGWLSDKDIRLIGDFFGLGHDQVLFINRDPVGHPDEGKVMIFDMSKGKGETKYWESFGATTIFNGWTEADDLQLAGDFMGRGHDQVLFVHRDPSSGTNTPYFGNKWRIMVVDFSKGKVPAEVLYTENSP
jgi:hypothetical protein